MVRFVDKYLADKIEGWPVEVAPMFSTQIAQVDSGAEQANARWQDALREISIPDGVRNQDTFEALKDHWLVMTGPAHTWPWRDPTDFASVPLTLPNEEPVISRTDVVIGTGDGATTRFRLIKRYDLGSPATPYDRQICFPVTSSVLIGIDGIDPGVLSPGLTWTVSRQGGYIDFSHAPLAGTVITAGFLFDIQVRFQADDTFRGILKTYAVSGFADIPLQEVRYCED